MAYKMSNAPLQAKLEMVKGPKGEMVPEYAVDGKGSNDMAAAKMMKNPVTKMAKSMAYASYKGIGKKVTDPPKQDYLHLKPKDARTYADSAAVEVTFTTGNPSMGEIAGKAASGGKISRDGKRFEQGRTPNSPEAKETLQGLRNIATKSGKNPMDAYKN
jgi:alkaline phosphatase